MLRVAVDSAVKDAEGGGRGQGWNKGTSRMLSFAVARAIVRKLKLKGKKEWQAWSKSGQRPSNIPSTPDRTYRDDGWISLPDWLGYGQCKQEFRLYRNQSTFGSQCTCLHLLELKNLGFRSIEENLKSLKRGGGSAASQ